MLRWIQRSEVYISMAIGFFFILLGIFILFNLDMLHNDSLESVEDLEIESVLDLLNTFFIEVLFVLSNLLGPSPFPLVGAIVMIMFGLGMMKVAQVILHTTKHDKLFSIFFIVLASLLFIATTILMYQVYGWTAFFFTLAFLVHMLYYIFQHYFDPKHRKEQFMIIMFFYGLAYFLTQVSVYSGLEGGLTPIDVLSFNIFFGVFWLLGFGALWVGVFLRQSLSDEIIEYETQEIKISRSAKHQRRINPNQYFKFSSQLYDFRNNVLNGVINFFEVGIPKWLRANHIELALGLMAFLIILIEFNNRHGVITEGYFRLDNMNYIYQWTNLAFILLIALLYLLITVLNMIQRRFYVRQMILIAILWLVVTVNLFITVMMDVELSLFILPFNALLVVLTTPLLILSIFKDFEDQGEGQNERNRVS